MKIGDKVRITEGVYRGLIGTITSIEGGKIYVDNDYIDAKKVWYYFDNLEPISDHMTADELAELITTPTDEIDNNFASGTADSTNQRTASGVDPYTAECGDPVIEYWYDQGYKDGHDKGYQTGMKAVITNIKRFLEEIAP